MLTNHITNGIVGLSTKTKGDKTMLSKELIKEVMSTEEYKNRPTYWVNRKTDRGLFISENEQVFVGTH